MTIKLFGAGKLLFAAVTSLSLAACATAPYPEKRPMSVEALGVVSETPVLVAENNTGIEKSWFMSDSSAAGAQYGLIGAFTTAIIDAIANAGPSRRAQQGADEIAEFIDAPELSASLRTAFETQIVDSDSDVSGVRVETVSGIQKLLVDTSADDALEVSVTYTLAEDGTAMRATAVASYSSTAIAYKTPYVFEGSVPKSELTGPLYRNVFIYESAQLPLPVMNEELRERLIESITESYTSDSGAVPVAGDEDYKAYQKELKEAEDETLSKPEASMFLVREWVKDDALQLKAEIEGAHDFFAEYIIADLNSSEVPLIDGEDKLVATLEDGRVIRIVGGGKDSGTYISSPGTAVAFPTYGNAVRIASVNEERVKALREEAKNLKIAAR